MHRETMKGGAHKTAPTTPTPCPLSPHGVEIRSYPVETRRDGEYI